MKGLFKFFKGVLIFLIIAVLAVLGGVWGFLKYGLTGTVQKHVLPEVSSQTGLDAELAHAELDIFRGSFLVKDLRVKNPSGFAEPDLMVAEKVEAIVDLKAALFKKQIEINSVKLNGAQVHVIRNSDKVYNVLKVKDELAKRFPEAPQSGSETTAKTEPESEKTAATSEVPMLPVWLKSLEFDFLADYVDHSENPYIENGHVKLSLRGRNISTVGIKDVPWGEIYLTGEFAADKYGFPVNFNMLIAPISSPDLLSFDLKGAPFEVDSGLLNKAIDKLGVASKKIRLDVDVKARDGVFVDPDSVIGTELQGVTLDKSVAGVELSASSLSFKVPVSGTVMKPVVDWQDAVKKMISDNRRVLVQEVGASLLNKAVKDEDKSGIQALGKALGLEVNLQSDAEKEAAKNEAKELTDSAKADSSTDKAETKEELSTEKKAIGGAIRVLQESQKEDGDVKGSAVNEIFKLFND